MTTFKTRITQSRTGIFLFLLSFLLRPALAQTDTLHLIYHHTQTKAHDTTLAHIDRWIKTLNGRHVDITVVGYFHKPEFKKFAQERVDEMFLILNRKARAQFTFGEFTTRHGKEYQRTMVDIIYKPTVSPEEAAAAAAKVKADAAKAKADADAAKAEEKKKKDEEKVAKEAEKGSKDSDKKKSKSEVAAEQTKKGDSAKEKDDDKKGDKEDEQDDADYGQASSRTINEGYTMTLDEVKYIKSAKFIVARTGRKSIDDNLYNAVKEFWNFSSNVVQMPYEQAIKAGKENKKDTSVIVSFIQVKTWFTEKHGPVTIKLLKIGYAIAIETGKGKLLVKQFIPKDKGKEPGLPYFAFGVTFLNNLCKVMYDNNLSKSSKADEYFDQQTPELKDKNLCLAEFQINANLPREEIKQYYTYPVTIYDDKKWEEAILQKKDVAYVMVVLIPRSPKAFWHYIVDAKTGKTYLVDMGPKVGLSAGWGTPNFDPSQSGFVDKSNLQRYVKGINKAESDNQDRAEDKAKDAEKEKEKAAKKEKEAEAKKAKEEQKKKEKEGKK